jgi:hypothetical protein
VEAVTPWSAPPALDALALVLPPAALAPPALVFEVDELPQPAITSTAIASTASRASPCHGLRPGLRFRGRECVGGSWFIGALS